jgi:hypothetical protein
MLRALNDGATRPPAAIRAALRGDLDAADRPSSLNETYLNPLRPST